MDSGLCSPVAPPSMAPGHPIRPSAGSKAEKSDSSASDHPLYNLGEQVLKVVTDNGLDTEVLLQLADKSCPLVSVSTICNFGNRVIFGRGGGVIYNLSIGMEVPFQRRGGVYALGLWVRKGDDAMVSENKKKVDDAKKAAEGMAKSAGFRRP